MNRHIVWIRRTYSGVLQRVLKAIQAEVNKENAKMSAANDNSPADLLLGADAIAAHLGITRRQTYRLVYDRIIPSFKAGGTVAARKSSLTRWMAEAEEVAA